MSTGLSAYKQIAKYAIECVLGSGAMGVVYKGYDSQIERHVAIKVLHDHLRQGDAGEELGVRFVQEAKAAARCLHPNIVTVFDFGFDEVPYIVMEFVEGIELRAHIRSKTEIPLPSATDIVIQVLDALGYAHEKGVVHRDIKPENIILLENGSIKISDFGVARLDCSDLTGTGYMIGTPNYMSPEALAGEHVDARSDIYSVGVVFFELVSRERFNRELNTKENLARLAESEHLTEKNRRSITKLLSRALHVYPNSRYQTCADFIQDLKAIDDLDLTLATQVTFPRPPDLVATVGRHSSSHTGSQWSEQTLDAMEQSLARYVGPMAKLLIKKASRSAQSLAELVAQMAEHIPNASERGQFLKAMDKSGIHASLTSAVDVSSTANAESSTRLATPTLSADQLGLVAGILTFYAGPIAHRLVQKLAQKHTDFAALIDACGVHIPDEYERKEFVRKARAIVSAATQRPDP